jgi:hypothetical protein
VLAFVVVVEPAHVRHERRRPRAASRHCRRGGAPRPHQASREHRFRRYRRRAGRRGARFSPATSAAPSPSPTRPMATSSSATTSWYSRSKTVAALRPPCTHPRGPSVAGPEVYPRRPGLLQHRYAARSARTSARRPAAHRAGPLTNQTHGPSRPQAEQGCKDHVRYRENRLSLI